MVRKNDREDKTENRRMYERMEVKGTEGKYSDVERRNERANRRTRDFLIRVLLHTSVKGKRVSEFAERLVCCCT